MATHPKESAGHWFNSQADSSGNSEPPSEGRSVLDLEGGAIKEIGYRGGRVAERGAIARVTSLLIPGA
jgi:hypothetical protein